MALNVGLSYNLVAEVPPGKPEDLYAEYDTWGTITAIENALRSRGYNVSLIEANEDAYEKIKKLRPEIIFNIAEGIRGESRESHIPAICEMLGIPYTGSGPLTLAITLNKARTKEILSHYRIPTPDFKIFQNPNQRLDKKLKFPLIVKPLNEGSSIGIRTSSVVSKPEELYTQVSYVNLTYNQPAIVERFLPGREFTVAILGNGKPFALPVIEVYLERYPKNTRGVYSFDAKTKWENDSFSGSPVNLDENLKKRVIELALKSHSVLGCRDFSRVDIRLDDEEKPQVLEVNPLPGLNPKVDAVSYFPKAARMAGMSYEELISKMLYYGLERNNLLGRLGDGG